MSRTQQSSASGEITFAHETKTVGMQSARLRNRANASGQELQTQIVIHRCDWLPCSTFSLSNMSICKSDGVLIRTKTRCTSERIRRR
jgi:hypothetical protein